jgi:hypothetical protein
MMTSQQSFTITSSGEYKRKPIGLDVFAFVSSCSIAGFLFRSSPRPTLSWRTSLNLFPESGFFGHLYSPFRASISAFKRAFSA